MKVAIAGSREFKHLELVSAQVALLYKQDVNLVIVSGGARGVDETAAETAKLLGVPVIEYLPDYQKHGAMAPLVRNALIIGDVTLVICFWNGLSRGTRNIIERCMSRHQNFSVIYEEC